LFTAILVKQEGVNQGVTFLGKILSRRINLNKVKSLVPMVVDGNFNTCAYLPVVHGKIPKSFSNIFQYTRNTNPWDRQLA